MQFALLCLFFILNYRSVKTFAIANNLVSVFKFIVPLLVIGMGIVRCGFFTSLATEMIGVRPK